MAGFFRVAVLLLPLPALGRGRRQSFNSRASWGVLGRSCLTSSCCFFLSGHEKVLKGRRVQHEQLGRQLNTAVPTC